MIIALEAMSDVLYKSTTTTTTTTTEHIYSNLEAWLSNQDVGLLP